MAPPAKASHGNLDVDYVISYRFTETSKAIFSTREASANPWNVLDKLETQQGLQSLLQALAQVGLAIEVRNGDNCSLLIFVKVASDKRLSHEVYRSRWVDKSPEIGYGW